MADTLSPLAVSPGGRSAMNVSRSVAHLPAGDASDTTQPELVDDSAQLSDIEIASASETRKKLTG